MKSLLDKIDNARFSVIFKRLIIGTIIVLVVCVGIFAWAVFRRGPGAFGRDGKGYEDAPFFEDGADDAYPRDVYPDDWHDHREYPGYYDDRDYSDDNQNRDFYDDDLYDYRNDPDTDDHVNERDHDYFYDRQ